MTPAQTKEIRLEWIGGSGIGGREDARVGLLERTNKPHSLSSPHHLITTIQAGATQSFISLGVDKIGKIS